MIRMKNRSAAHSEWIYQNDNTMVKNPVIERDKQLLKNFFNPAIFFGDTLTTPTTTTTTNTFGTTSCPSVISKGKTTSRQQTKDSHVIETCISCYAGIQVIPVQQDIQPLQERDSRDSISPDGVITSTTSSSGKFETRQPPVNPQERFTPYWDVVGLISNPQHDDIDLGGEEIDNDSISSSSCTRSSDDDSISIRSVDTRIGKMIKFRRLNLLDDQIDDDNSEPSLLFNNAQKEPTRNGERGRGIGFIDFMICRRRRRHCKSLAIANQAELIQEIMVEDDDCLTIANDETDVEADVGRIAKNSSRESKTKEEDTPAIENGSTGMLNVVKEETKVYPHKKTTEQTNNRESAEPNTNPKINGSVHSDLFETVSSHCFIGQHRNIHCEGNKDTRNQLLAEKKNRNDRHMGTLARFKNSCFGKSITNEGTTDKKWPMNEICQNQKNAEPAVNCAEKVETSTGSSSVMTEQTNVEGIQQDTQSLDEISRGVTNSLNSAMERLNWDESVEVTVGDSAANTVFYKEIQANQESVTNECDPANPIDDSYTNNPTGVVRYCELCKEELSLADGWVKSYNLYDAAKVTIYYHHLACNIVREKIIGQKMLLLKELLERPVKLKSQGAGPTSQKQKKTSGSRLAWIKRLRKRLRKVFA